VRGIFIVPLILNDVQGDIPTWLAVVLLVAMAVVIGFLLWIVYDMWRYGT
jgi:hypothetical protein